MLSTVLANEKAFNAISEAAVALNCETLQSAIGQAGLLTHCESLCFFICTWRCGWVCREFCTVNQPITGVYDIEEARTFALATRQLATQPRALGDLLAAVQSRDAKAFAEIITNYRLGSYCMQVCAWVCSQVCYSYCTCVCPNPALDPWFYLVGNFDIYTQINPTSGRTNVSLPGPPSGMPWGGGPNFAFQGQLQLGGWCPAYSPAFPSDLMQYRFLYATASTTLAVAITAGDTSIGVSSSSGVPSGSFNALLCTPTESPETGEIINVTGVSGTTWTVSRGQDGTTAISAPAGSTLWINLQPITNNLVDLPLLVGQKNVLWPPLAGGGLAGPGLVSTPEQVYVGYGTDATMPAPGAPYGLGPTHYIKPDVATGWIAVDPAVTGEGFKNLLNFDTTRLLPANCPLPGSAPCWGPCFGTPGGAPAGTAVPPANQGAGTDLAIIFQASRVTVSTVDYSNSLCKIHVNNWCEVNNLWFAEFGSGGCCNPIDTSLSVEFTVDHEEMDAGAWTLSINSCPSGSAPGDITPHVSSPGPPAVTVTPRGGSGTIIENTTTWSNCSYTVSLNTRPGLTSGLIDRDWVNNQLTFCICGHNATTLAAAIDATQTSINTTSSAGFPPAPFSVTVGGTGEVMTVNTMSGTMWTVLRGQSGTTAAPAPAGATLTET